MIVRIAAALWSLAVLSSAVSVGRTLLASRRSDTPGPVVNALVERTRRLGKIERYVSLVLMVAVVAAFFAGSLNTELWPTSTAAWIALLGQSMFLRPYLTNYAELIGRGFERAIERVLVPYVVLDVVMLVLLIRLLVDGTV